MKLPMHYSEVSQAGQWRRPRGAEEASRTRGAARLPVAEACRVAALFGTLIPEGCQPLAPGRAERPGDFGRHSIFPSRRDGSHWLRPLLGRCKSSVLGSGGVAPLNLRLSQPDWVLGPSLRLHYNQGGFSESFPLHQRQERSWKLGPKAAKSVHRSRVPFLRRFWISFGLVAPRPGNAS